jgi:hypothetical protein
MSAETGSSLANRLARMREVTDQAGLDQADLLMLGDGEVRGQPRAGLSFGREGRSNE